MSNKKKVLFFDDEPFISGALAQTLQFYEWDVKLVSEINELFKIIKETKEHYDIVILDIMAPIPDKNNSYIDFKKNEIEDMNKGMSTGIVLAKRIWSISQYEQIPILFLSAKSNPIQSDKELEAKNCDYLRKPALASDVSEKLEEMLDK